MASAANATTTTASKRKSTNDDNDDTNHQCKRHQQSEQSEQNADTCNHKPTCTTLTCTSLPGGMASSMSPSQVSHERCNDGPCNDAPCNGPCQMTSNSMECQRCHQRPVRCAETLFKLRQMTMDANGRSSTEEVEALLAADDEWQQCDINTRRQLLSFYDEFTGLPFICRPLRGLLFDPSAESQLFGLLLTLGFPLNLPPHPALIPSIMKHDNIWHLVFVTRSIMMVHQVFNALFHHCSHHDMIPWRSSITGESILDAAMTWGMSDQVIEALILAGADIHELDQMDADTKEPLLIDAQDDRGDWYAANVIERYLTGPTKVPSLFIHYIGRSHQWNEWIDSTSSRLAAVGTHSENRARGATPYQRAQYLATNGLNDEEWFKLDQLEHLTNLKQRPTLAMTMQRAHDTYQLREQTWKQTVSDCTAAFIPPLLELIHQYYGHNGGYGHLIQLPSLQWNQFNDGNF